MRTDQISLLQGRPGPRRPARRAAPRRGRARAARAAPTGSRSGPWDVTRLSSASADHIGLLILDGVIARELIVGGPRQRRAARPGRPDPRPWQSDSRRAACCRWTREWTVLVARDARRARPPLRRRCCRIGPEIMARCSTACRSARCAWRPTQAISQLTRVDRRLEGAVLAPRRALGPRRRGRAWSIPLALTHRMLGELVGARRPTVSTALARARRARRARPAGATGRGCCAGDPAGRGLAAERRRCAAPTAPPAEGMTFMQATPG